MKTQAVLLIVLTGLILGGISYWVQPYSQLSLQESLIIPIMWSAGPFFGALSLKSFLKGDAWRMAFYISGGFVLAVLGRIVFDLVFIDRTHHNLAPFELGFCAIITLPFSFAGAYLSVLIKKLKK